MKNKSKVTEKTLEKLLYFLYFTYINFGEDDVNKTSHHDEKIEDVPRIREVNLPK